KEVARQLLLPVHIREEVSAHHQEEEESIAKEQEAADRIAAEVGYLPLMLELIATFLEEDGYSCRTYLMAYPAHTEPERVAEAKNARIDLSYGKLDTEAATVFKVAACFAGYDISREMLWEACSAMGLFSSRDRFLSALGAVVRFGLLKWQEESWKVPE